MKIAAADTGTHDKLTLLPRLIPLSGKTVEVQNRSQRRPLRKLSIQISLPVSLVLQICTTCKLLIIVLYPYLCNTPSFKRKRHRLLLHVI